MDTLLLSHPFPLFIYLFFVSLWFVLCFTRLEEVKAVPLVASRDFPAVGSRFRSLCKSLSTLSQAFVYAERFS